MIGVKHLCTTAIGRALERGDHLRAGAERAVSRAARRRLGADRDPRPHGPRRDARGRRESDHGARRAAAGGPRARAPIPEALPQSPHLRPPTVTPTVVRAPVQGVEQSNVIPSRARALLDIRLTPGPDEAAVAREIDATCRRAMARCPGSVDRVGAGERLPAGDPKVERGEPLVRAMVARRPSGDGPARRLRRRPRLDRRDDPPDAARHPHRHLRPGSPAHSPPGRRVRRGAPSSSTRRRSTSPRL